MGMSCSNLGMNTFQHGKPKSHRRGARSIVQQQLQGIKRESLQMELRLFVLLFSRKYSTFRTPLLLLRSLSRRRRSSLLPPLSCPPNSPVPPSLSPLSLTPRSRLAHASLTPRSHLAPDLPRDASLQVGVCDNPLRVLNYSHAGAVDDLDVPLGHLHHEAKVDLGDALSKKKEGGKKGGCISTWCVCVCSIARLFSILRYPRFLHPASQTRLFLLKLPDGRPSLLSAAPLSAAPLSFPPSPAVPAVPSPPYPPPTHTHTHTPHTTPTT